VRGVVRRWRRLGIDGVPATVIDGRHLIPGAQSVEDYEHALRRLVAASIAST
jgi:predicted DsbA family dithiol-disulfide isomerase